MKHLRPLSEFIVKKGLQTGPFGSQLKAEEYTATGIPVVMPKDIFSGYIQEKTIVRIPADKAEALKKHHLQEGDILFPRRGDLGRIGIATKKNAGWICGTGCLRARLDTSVLPEYMHQYLMRPEIKQWLENNALGQTMLNLNTEIIAQLPVYIPSFEEQRKVASILTDVDHAIETTKRLIAAKERYFDGLSSKLMHNPLFSKVHVYQITSEVSIRNKDNCIRVLSVTNKNGFVLPEDHFDRRVASENVSNYKLVKKGQYAYNPSRINVGSIARLDEWDEGILSPMYTIFEIDEAQVNSDFFLHWLSSYNAKQRIKKSAQGSVRETVSFGDFGAITIPLPSMEEQNKIAEILNTAKREIDLLKKLAESYRLQKRGLMQKLLSGEWRVAA